MITKQEFSDMIDRLDELGKQIEAHPSELWNYGSNQIDRYFHNQLLSLHNEKWNIEAELDPSRQLNNINIFALKPKV